MEYHSRLSRVSSRPHHGSLRWPMVYLGVALTTMATLVLELALTRIFSVIFYYHFAFLAISVALFGLGAGGVLSYVVAPRNGSLFARLGTLSMLAAALVTGALTFLLSQQPGESYWILAAVYLITSLPFCVAGSVVSLAISETVERVDRVYFYDLTGAAGGCLLLLPLLNNLGGPNTVLAAAVLYAASGAIWFTVAGASRGRIGAVAGGLALCLLVGYNYKNRVLDVRWAKGQELRQEIQSWWNSFSRIALAPEPGTGRMQIIIDADAATGIANFNMDNLTAGDREALLSQGPGLPFALRPGAKTLVIGPGGGWDVARALASGSREITGVEINPIIARTIMQGPRYRHLSRRLYERPEVSIHVEDGRSYVRRSREKFQVVQATLVDTWAATAAGAFALTENNLYTTEAFGDYLGHLTLDGMLAFSRWGFRPPRESLRLITLAIAALERMGEHEPWRHIIVARENVHLLDSWGALDTVLISRKPFTGADVRRTREICERAGMGIVYLPGDRSRDPFSRLLHAPDRQEFLDNYAYDVTPVSDDRPFFFYTVQPWDVWEFFARARRESADFKINNAVPMLFGLVAVSLVATGVTLALPPLVLASRLPRERGVRAFLLYFLCVGAGYILIQVSLIQKFVLFLGHPTYALTAIIFSMLVSSGLGSYWSRRLGAFDERRLYLVLGAVAVLVTLLALVVTPVARYGVGWPFPARVLASVLLIAPAGFVMGMPFPSGLYRLEQWHSASVRWAWSLNAASSVLGSALAIFLALYLGLRVTLLAGGALYLMALVTLRMARPAGTERG